jgi:uncharacterized membrane protein
LSTIEVGSKHSRDLTDNFSKFYQAANNDPKGKYKAYVLRGDRQRMADFLTVLRLNGIKYGYAGKEGAAAGYDYQKDQTTTVSYQPDDVVVSIFQPASVLATVLLEPNTFVADSNTYDITAWSLPFAFGLDAYGLTTRLEPDSAYKRKQELAPQPSDKTIAFAVEGGWKQIAFLARAQAMGMRARAAHRPFTVDGRSYPAGTVVVSRGDNRFLGADFARRIQQVAVEAGVWAYPINTGFVEKGPDLASDFMPAMRKASVAVLHGDNTDNNAYGAVWYLLEQKLQQPFSSIQAENLSAAVLNQYNTLIVPDGYYDNEAIKKRIAEWVSQGGRLILLGGAVRSFVGLEGFALQEKAPAEKETDTTKQHRHPRFCDEMRHGIAYNLPGAIFTTDIDDSHPLLAGISRYHTLKNTSDVYGFSDRYQSLVRIGEQPVVRGFAGSVVKPKLSDTPVLAVQQSGSGKIVYFIDDPTFRAFWYQGLTLFANSLYH